MGRSKKSKPREVKVETLDKWIFNPKSQLYLKKKLLEALESGT